ncbi:sensor histidine kinase [Dyadobacter psychrotolerans]|uniref:histidine kinase n=1 Tax=Dyadobacter psychrotolerans TaxID=2541721 RepID=A0A4R5DY46_9BACT|nr:ATP-binding protein [Dyadobacter psychrotolerans]TDE17634.1 histidine kinase [Dyadobacter psychrotolerans]
MDYFLVSSFLIFYVRKILQTKTQLPEWDKKLEIVKYISIALLGTYYVADSPDWYQWIWHAFLIFLLVVGYRNEVFRPVRGLLQSAIPFVLISVINDSVELIAPKFYAKNDDYFATAAAFAFVLCFVIWFYVQKQQKALILEREERIKEELASKAQKESLEYLVAERTYELTLQKEELQKTIDELKSTQNQLIQSEKMASLGELTAGIAHEIQNPLNFVNNFSEVSVELCQELEEEIDKTTLPESDKEYIKEIISDLSQNQQKITHHGKRADSIVKGMLQHSRVSSGEKELVDINALADEYMRLAYHGLRAKNKEFNAALVTDFDPTIGQVEVMPQDLGRVFLNLFTNAFYAVAEKKRLLAEEGTVTDYRPEVKITTKKFADTLYIRVTDNGTGMPETVKAKIFQPFFTTKPTGQGTGLGLSMSYDIITNAHGGSLDVETVPGKKTEFKITLPLEKV